MYSTLYSHGKVKKVIASLVMEEQTSEAPSSPERVGVCSCGVHQTVERPSKTSTMFVMAISNQESSLAATNRIRYAMFNLNLRLLSVLYTRFKWNVNGSTLLLWSEIVRDGTILTEYCAIFFLGWVGKIINSNMAAFNWRISATRK